MAGALRHRAQRRRRADRHLIERARAGASNGPTNRGTTGDSLNSRRTCHRHAIAPNLVVTGSQMAPGTQNEVAMDVQVARYAGGMVDPTADLYDALKIFKDVVGVDLGLVGLLIDHRGAPDAESAAEHAVIEMLCERGRGDQVAATIAEFRAEGSVTRARYLRILARMAEQYVPWHRGCRSSWTSLGDASTGAR